MKVQRLEKVKIGRSRSCIRRPRLQRPPRPKQWWPRRVALIIGQTASSTVGSLTGRPLGVEAQPPGDLTAATGCGG
jgi:hypothetical protein